MIIPSSAKNSDKVFRYVDDFLVLVGSGEEPFPLDMARTLAIFKDSLKPPEVTIEITQERSHKFLDLRLTSSSKHVCWMYDRRYCPTAATAR